MSKLRVQEIAHSNGTTAFTVDASGNMAMSGNMGGITTKGSVSGQNILHIDNSAGTGTHGAINNNVRVTSDNNAIWANLVIAGHDFRVQPQGGNVALIVDSASRVTTPYQPSFMVYGGWSYDANYIWKGFATVDHNIGGHWNNTIGRFTAPIAGRYMIYATVHNGGTSVYHLWAFAKNGGLTSSNWVQDYNNSAGANTTSKQQVWNLAANDYLEVVSNATYANGYTGGYVTVGGYLVG